jgi:hypothetical protein
MSSNVKHVAVSVAGIGGDPNRKEIKQIDIEPGTTAGDVLRAIGQPDFALSTRRLSSINQSENLYPLVENGEEIFANLSLVAGC